jgi:hypothetical protein
MLKKTQTPLTPSEHLTRELPRRPLEKHVALSAYVRAGTKEPRPRRTPARSVGYLWTSEKSPSRHLRE